MGQKYKVFSDKSLIHINESPKNNIPTVDLEYIENFQSFRQLTCDGEIQITSNDTEVLHNRLFQNFQHLTAAGGLVTNSGKVLLIKRFGYWDLPKGKLEKGEDLKSCAIREVMEECGVNNDLTIVNQLSPSYHVYQFKSRSFIKKTYWFHMNTSHSEKLIPQLDEDITECRWVPLEDIDVYLTKAFPLIRSLLNDFIYDK